MCMVLARHVATAICLAIALCAFAHPFTVEMLPREHWWGVCNSFGTNMPFTGETGGSDDALDGVCLSAHGLCGDR